MKGPIPKPVASSESDGAAAPATPDAFRETRSGTRPTVHARGSVDTILREYLNKATTPSMEAVRLPVMAYAAPLPGMSGIPTRPPDVPPPPDVFTQAANIEADEPPEEPQPYEDERPTGRWAETPAANPRDLVRDRGVLVRLDSEASGEVLSLPRDTVLIGRSSRAQVHITDPSVSRNHARIVFEFGAFYIVDDGSQNGTLLAGRRVTRAELRDGDLLQFGQRAQYRFSLMDQTQEQVMRRLYDSSMKDALTGADNRRHMDTRLLAEIAFAERHKRPLSIVLLDIDFFKNVNDRHGHGAGDEVLKEVAAQVRGQLRTEDALARYGGEEFVVVLRDTALPEAHLVAERVREKIARTTIPVDGVSLAVTISAGCAALTCCLGSSTEELVSVADRRLYRAKRGGRNRVVFKDD
jgi:two-component system, cell cycle response regulator